MRQAAALDPLIFAVICRYAGNPIKLRAASLPKRSTGHGRTILGFYRFAISQNGGSRIEKESIKRNAENRLKDDWDALRGSE